MVKSNTDSILYVNLASAVIRDFMEEYRTAVKLLKKAKRANNVKAVRKLTNLIEGYRAYVESDDFDILTLGLANPTDVIASVELF